jgi:hypothetical protein
MDEQNPQGFVCPECGKHSAHPKDLEFGYCGECHAFTGAAQRAAELGDDVPQFRYSVGGLMRCCIQSLAAWVVLHPGPWEAGRYFMCRHHDSMVLYDGERWRWSNGPEDLEVLRADT